MTFTPVQPAPSNRARKTADPAGDNNANSEAIKALNDYVAALLGMNETVTGQWDFTGGPTKAGVAIATVNDVAGGISLEGAWDVGTAYSVASLVTHTDQAWVAQEDTVAGEEPGVSPKWFQLPIAVDVRLDSGTAVGAVPVWGGARYAEQAKPLTDVRDHGAPGDGAADESAAIQAVLTDAVDGDRILFSGRHRIDSGLSWSGKRLNLIFGPHATLVEGAPIAGPMVSGTNADGSVVAALRVEGIETEASYEAAGDVAPSDRCAVKFDGSHGVRVAVVDVVGKSIGVKLDNCTGAVVSHVTLNGFATATTTNVQYHTAVNVNSSTKALLDGIQGNEVGSVVLGTMNVSYVSIANPIGTDCFDNGVYISSGRHCSVRGGHLAMTVAGEGGDGVKMRGSHHVVAGVTVRRFSTGVAMTGNGATPDAYGANGVGNSVTGCTVEDVTQDGIRIGAQDGLYQRDAVVSNNTLVGTATSGGGFAAIRGGGWRFTITGNVIVDCGGTTGTILFSGESASHHDGYSISGNILTGCAGDGIRIAWVDGCSIIGNIGRDVAGQLVQMTDTVDCTIAHNRKSGTGSTVSIYIASAGAENCTVAWNHGGTVTDAGTNTEIIGDGPRPELTYSRTGETTPEAQLRTALAAWGMVTDNTTA